MPNSSDNFVLSSLKLNSKAILYFGGVFTCWHKNGMLKHSFGRSVIFLYCKISLLLGLNPLLALLTKEGGKKGIYLIQGKSINCFIESFEDYKVSKIIVS